MLYQSSTEFAENDLLLSPRSVVNPALQILDEDKDIQAHPHVLFSKECTLSSNNIASPPQDEITTDSSCSDESSSVSSLSYTETSRSIFKSYWQKEGQEYFLQRMTPLPKHSISETFHESNVGEGSLHVNVYEQTLKVDEETPKESSMQYPSRRNIFGKNAHFDSAPILTIGGLARRTSFRKSQSASTLDKRRASCFRKPQSSRKRSVSFSEEVSVVVFQTPQEMWAADGWSDWFA